MEGLLSTGPTPSSFNDTSYILVYDALFFVIQSLLISAETLPVAVQLMVMLNSSVQWRVTWI